MQTQRALVGISLALVFPFSIGCKVGFGLQPLVPYVGDTGDSGEEAGECSEPPSTLLVDITVTSSREEWSGNCGPKTLKLTYDLVEYKWFGKPETSILCDGAEEVIQVTDIEAKFVGSAYDWCEMDLIQMNGTVGAQTIAGDEQAFDCPIGGRMTDFWPDSADSSGVVYAGDPDDSEYEPWGNAFCDNVVVIFTDPRVSW